MIRDAATRSTAGGWLPLAVVAALLGAAMLGAVFGNPTVDRVPESGPAPASTPAIPPPAPAPNQLPAAEPTAAAHPSQLDLPAWLVGGGCLAVVVGLVAALLWLMVRDRRTRWPGKRAGVTDEPAARLPAPDRVRAAVQGGLIDLDDADLDPRRSVIACWVRLEQAAAEAGTVRQPGDTSTDLVRRLLATHRISEVVLDRFAGVYREARYATHFIDSSMRDDARAALRQLRDELLVAAP